MRASSPPLLSSRQPACCRPQLTFTASRHRLATGPRSSPVVPNSPSLPTYLVLTAKPHPPYSVFLPQHANFKYQQIVAVVVT